jgi:hypothetical protein
VLASHLAYPFVRLHRHRILPESTEIAQISLNSDAGTLGCLSHCSG